MKRLTITLTGLLLVIFIQAQTISQQVIGSAGESYENGSISISWTIGEVAVETLEQNGLILTQGFQQGYFEITSVDEIPLSSILVEIYPNPAKEYINIEVKHNDEFDIVVEMFDLQGRLVKNRNIEKGTNRIELELTNLSASQYILRLSKKNGELVQTFKLIKK